MCGSLVKLLAAGGVITELKNVSMDAFNTPSGRPVFLSSVRRRPFTATMNCAGPIAPIESGGKALVSASVAPVKASGVPLVPNGPGWLVRGDAGEAADPRSLVLTRRGNSTVSPRGP